MSENLSPKMQELVTKLEAGTQVIINHFGHFHTYEVRDNGTTWGGTRANPTVKALISRGIVVQNAAGEWVLASTIETPAEVEVEVEVAAEPTPARTSATLMTVGMLVKRLNGTEIFEVTNLTRTRKGVHILARPVNGGPERLISKHAGDTWKDIYWNVSA